MTVEDSNITVKMNWKNLSRNNIAQHKNWFVCFIPHKWGLIKTGLFGIHFGFAYRKERRTNLEYVRLHVGVESPLKTEHKEQFKEDVVNELERRNISLLGFDTYPNAGIRKGGKLLEADFIPLNEGSWEIALKKYLELEEFIDTVSRIIKEYNKLGRFKEILEFPA